MDDAALVAAASRGDREAWGLVYDRYADRLHDHCWSILRDEHEAADALHDTFLKAAEALPQLRDPSRLRPWLYAIARNEAFRRHRARTRAVPTADLGTDEIGEVGTVTVDLEDASGMPVEDLRRLVWDAAGGLSEDDKALLDLHLRQGLEGEELAEAMGITANNAYVKMSRLRDTLERSLGALLVARTGRRDCPELEAILADWGGTLSPLLRKRVARHIDDCETCGERKRSLVSPMALFAGMPLVPAPPGLRDQVVDGAVAASLTAAPPAPDVLFPVPSPAPVPAPPPVPPSGPPPAGAGADRDRSAWPWVLGGVAALIALLVAVLLLSPSDDDVATGDSTTSSSTTSTSSSSTTTSSTSSTTSSTTSTTSTSTTAVPGSLALDVVSINLGLTDVRGQFTISNPGGTPVSYVTTTTDGALAVDQATIDGTIPPGESRTVFVTLDRARTVENRRFSADVRVIDAAGTTQSVTVTARTAARQPTVDITETPSAINSGTICPTTTASVQVTYRDESRIGSAELVWVSSTGSHRHVLTASPATVVVGPEPETGPTGPTEITYTVTVTDDHGATTVVTDAIDVRSPPPCLPPPG